MFSSRALKKRVSAKTLATNKKSIKRLYKIIDELLEETREAFRRKGYPRAGAFDRLAIAVFTQKNKEQLNFTFYLPAPRVVYQRKITIEGTLTSLVSAQEEFAFNALVLVGYHTSSGTSKYGEELNSQFAHLEQGIFLQALHSELSYKNVPNHLQGGLRLENLVVQLPWDIEGISGLVV